MKFATAFGAAGIVLACHASAREFKACHSDNNDINILLGIPRRGLSFQSVSSDLSSYDSVLDTCNGTNGLEICSAPWLEDISDDVMGTILNKDYAAANPGSWANYFQGLIVYGGVGIAFAVIALIAGIVSCICRCCCCKKEIEIVIEEGEDDVPHAQTYPVWKVVGINACLALFFILIFTFTLLAQIRGNRGLTNAQLALVDAPDNFVELASGLADPAVSLVSSLVGKTGVQLLERANQTLFVSVDIPVIHTAFGCAKEIFDLILKGSLLSSFVTVLDEIEGNVNVLSGDLQSFITDSTSKFTNLEAALNATLDLISNFSSTVGGINLSDIETKVQSVTDQKDYIRNNTLPPAKNSLTKYNELSTSVNTLQVSVSPLAAATSAWTLASLNTYNSSFYDTKSKLNALPPNGSVSGQISALKVSTDEMKSRLNSLKLALEAADASIAQSASLSDISLSLSNLKNSLAAFNFSEMKYTVTDFTARAFDGALLQPVFDKVAEVLVLKDYIPCIMPVLEIPDKLNKDLIQLPEDVMNATEQFRDFNQTISNVTRQLDDVEVELQKVRSSMVTQMKNQTNGVLDTLDDIQANVDSTRSQISDLQAQMSSYDTNILDSASAITQIDNIIALLDGGDFPQDPSFLADLESAATSMSTYFSSPEMSALESKVNILIGKNVPESETCTSPNSNTCYTVTGTGGASYDSNCIDCPYPQLEWSTLKTKLTDFADKASSANLNGKTNAVTNLQSQLTDISLTCCTDFSALKDIQTQATSSQTSIVDARSTITSSFSVFNDIQDVLNKTLGDSFSTQFADARQQLTKINSTVSGDFDTAMIDDILQKESDIYKLLTSDLGDILDEIRSDKLLALMNGKDGIEGALKLITRNLDKIINVVDNTTSISNQTKDLLAIARVVDAARDKDGEYKSQGSLYYMQKLIQAADEQSGSSPSGSLTVNDAAYYEKYSYPTVSGYVEDGVLVEYPDSSTCLTDKCLKNAVEYYNGEPIKSFAPDEINQVFAVPFSRTQGLGLLFIIPSLLLVITLLAFVYPRCGTVLAGCSICIMPILFILIGSFVFPFVIMTADMCASTEGVAEKAIGAVAPVLCQNLNGTLTSEGYCLYNVSAPPFSKLVELDAQSIVTSYLEDCSASSGANLVSGDVGEPVGALFDSFGLEASLIVQQQIAKLISDTLPGAGIVLRPLLIADVESVSSNLQDDVKQLSKDLNAALGCAKVYKAYAGFKDAFCCDVSQALYWSIASWYLMAFTMLFCGLPVGCLVATKIRGFQESRAALRDFYRELGETRVGQRIGGAREAMFGKSDRSMVVADVVDEESFVGEGDKPPAGRMRQRLNNLGESFRSGGASFKQKVKGAFSKKRSEEEEVELSFQKE